MIKKTNLYDFEPLYIEMCVSPNISYICNNICIICLYNAMHRHNISNLCLLGGRIEGGVKGAGVIYVRFHIMLRV